MNADIGLQGFGQYDAACRELQKLLVEFEAACEGSESYLPLLHQLIWFDGPLTAQQLSAFQKASTKHKGDWQKWDEFPDRNPCGRFFGFEQSHGAFVTLANRGIEILRRIAKLKDVEGVVLPGDLVLDLPAFGGHLAWVYLLYDTARAFSTPVLHVDQGYWACTGQVDDEEGNLWKTTSEGITYPVHPPFEKLSSNVFKASAEAISLWFDPDAAIGFEEPLDDPTVYLPPEPQQNGPQVPDKFWLRGTCYKGFTHEEWRLLECLWGKEWVTTDDVIRHIWSDAEDEKEGAVKSLYKRLNAKLRENKCPATVRKKKEGFVLVVYPQPTRLPPITQEGGC